MKWTTRKDTIWVSFISVLGIACFPANPLVLSGVIETPFYLPLFIIGWFVWAGGMVLVMAPIITFPRKGGIRKGKSFVNTTKLVDSGIYAVVRHPQYLGGVISIFITCILWYPHWLFALLGVIGAVSVYLSTREEDKNLIKKFGDEYAAYIKKVPGMNIFLGIWRVSRQTNS
jgi:protein-S-isoprenylcysteine O-methyltransferase Ste14